LKGLVKRGLKCVKLVISDAHDGLRHATNRMLGANLATRPGSLDAERPAFTGVGLACGYALLGAGWLVMKSEGTLQDWARALRRRCLVLTVLAIAIVSVWTSRLDAHIEARWFSWPNIALLSPVPIITLVLIWFVWRALDRGADFGPFLGSLGVFVMSYIGIAISLWPMIVPGHFTLDEVAASQSTQAFLLVGTLALLPIILVYTSWSCWVFPRQSARPISATTRGQLAPRLWHFNLASCDGLPLQGAERRPVQTSICSAAAELHAGSVSGRRSGHHRHAGSRR
jgi:cytochrome bd-type quinol oxidase subunit 2